MLEIGRFEYTREDIQAPGHYDSAFNPELFQGMVRKCTDALLQVHNRRGFDAIAVCGVSGLVLGGALSFRMECPLVVIRKPIEDGMSHHGHRTTGLTRGRVLLLDDLISTGKTVEHMLKCLRADTYLRPVGLFLYGSRYYGSSTRFGEEVPVYYIDDVLRGEFPKPAEEKAPDFFGFAT